jgi:hypothetical protein
LKTRWLTFFLIDLFSIGKVPEGDYINVLFVSTTELNALIELVEVKGERLAIHICLPYFEL